MGKDKSTGLWSRIRLGMLAGVIALVASQAALAQGFMVQPMTMEVAARAGQTIEVPLQIRNMAGGQVGAIDVRLVELSQGPDGGWRAIEPQSAEDTSGLSSSLAWSSLSQSSVQIAPLEPAEVMVRIRVPSAARGAYFAGVIAEAPVSEDATGLAVRVRFLIPLIVEIEGRPARQQVALEDVDMTYDDEASRPTTRAHLSVANRGQTFSRVSGSCASSARATAAGVRSPGSTSPSVPSFPEPPWNSAATWSAACRPAPTVCAPTFTSTAGASRRLRRRSPSRAIPTSTPWPTTRRSF